MAQPAVSFAGRRRSAVRVCAALALAGVLLPAAAAEATATAAPAAVAAGRVPAATSLELSLRLSGQTAPDPSGSGAGVVLRPAERAADTPSSTESDPEAVSRPARAQLIENLAVLSLLVLCAVGLGRRHRKSR